MNQFHIPQFVMTIFLTGFVLVAELPAQPKKTEGPQSVEKGPDIAGVWLSGSPLDSFVQDDSPQPVNTFRVFGSLEADFKARYIGSRTSSVFLNWNPISRHFEGSKEIGQGKASFIVIPTDDPDVLNCEIEGGDGRASIHKDVWTRVRQKSLAPKFLETNDFILAETKSEFVAYNKLTGNWTKLEIEAPSDKSARLDHIVVSPGFASARIEQEFVGYCNQLSRWSRLPIPSEHFSTAKLRHTPTLVSATIGDKLFILSAITGEWVTPDADQKLSDQSKVIGILSDISPNNHTPNSHPPQADSEKKAQNRKVWRAAERYADARTKFDALHPITLEAQRELERLLNEAFEITLKEDQQQIIELKERTRLLEARVEKRTSDQTSVIRQRTEELAIFVHENRKDLASTDGKLVPFDDQGPILKYAEHDQLTPTMIASTEELLSPFVSHMRKLGFNLKRGQTLLRVQPGMGGAHYYHNLQTIVIDPMGVLNEPLVLREYTHHAHAVSLGTESKEVFETCSGIESGFADYFGVSFLSINDKGPNQDQRDQAAGDEQPPTRLANQRTFTEVNDTSERHDLGDVVSGALWEMREEIGSDDLDPILYKTWVGLVKYDAAMGQIARFSSSLLDVAQKEDPKHADKIRAILIRRGAELK